MYFRHLARDRDPRVRRDRSEIGEQIADAIRALVQDERATRAEKLGELAPTRAALFFWKTDEREFAGRQSRRDERGDRSGRARDRHDLVPSRDRRGDELLAGIRKAGGAGIGHERDVPPAIHLANELRHLAAVVELGVAREVLRANLVLAQKDLRMSRVLARDHVDLLKDPQRAQRHVLEIPDRGRDEIELAYGLTVTLRRSPSRPQLTIRRGRRRKICRSYPRPKASPPEARTSARPRISMPLGRQGETEARASTTNAPRGLAWASQYFLHFARPGPPLKIAARW